MKALLVVALLCAACDRRGAPPGSWDVTRPDATAAAGDEPAPPLHPPADAQPAPSGVVSADAGAPGTGGAPADNFAGADAAADRPAARGEAPSPRLDAGADAGDAHGCPDSGPCD